MKIKFFVAALAAVSLLASCTQENLAGDDPNGGGENIQGKTYATFNLNIAKTKAVADFTPTPYLENDTKDKNIAAATDVRLMIFNATTKVLEYNDLFSETGKATVLVTAGNKKIFVIANAKQIVTTATQTPPTANNFEAAVETLAPGTATLDDFYTITYKAGTPQEALSQTVKGTTARTFSIVPLHTWVNSTTGGLPASNSNQITYTLKANISDTESSDAAALAAASVTGESPTNTFSIQLNYMLAKARLEYDTAALKHTEDGVDLAIISDIKYSIHNIARVTNYVQNYVGAQAQSWYYGKTYNKASAASGPYFTEEFDRASNVLLAAKENKAPTHGTGEYLYVTENNNSNLKKGQASYFAIMAKYLPKFVVDAVNYSPVADPKVSLPTKDMSVPATFADNNYIYVRVAIAGPNGTIPVGTCFKDLDLLKKAAWLVTYGDATATGGWLGADATQLSNATTLIGADNEGYYQFFDGTSWYRLNIGEGSGDATVFGVLRGNAYQALITKIMGPGLPTEGQLDDDEDTPVTASTYVTAVIKAAEWKPIAQQGTVQ